MILASGGTMAETPGDADVAIFNSCAVTAEAEAALRQAVRRAAPGTTMDRATLPRSIVMGCAAALDSGVIAALPGVRAVIPGDDLAALADALGIAPGFAVAAPDAQSGSRALLRIQDGCDEHCTFCATTLARGASRSRALDDVVREAAGLAAHHPEIVLTGVHIGTYGADCGSSLGILLGRLVAALPGVRFRLTSIEATEVDGRLAELLTRRDGTVAPNLHAPLQSGSDRVLKRMGRSWYTAAGYARAIHRLTLDGGPFGLGADIIVGFPGETEADHAATVALVRDLPFTYLHVFPWSPRPGTAAAHLNDRPRSEVTRRRAAELRAVGEEKSSRYRRARAGGFADVVVLGAVGKRTGLTEDYLSVTLGDPSLPRRSRLQARLELVGTDGLVARTSSPALPGVALGAGLTMLASSSD